MNADGAVSVHRHTHAVLVRDGASVASELAMFLRAHQRSAGDAVAVLDALYAITLRDETGQIVGAVTVNLPADLTTAAALWAGTPRRTHLITHLAVHPDHRGVGHGRRLIAAVHTDPFTARHELVIAVSYAVDHADGFWNHIGYTLTRRAMPAVLPADVVGLAAPAHVEGISAGNAVDPARFVYRDITQPSVLDVVYAAGGTPYRIGTHLGVLDPLALPRPVQRHTYHPQTGN